MRVQTKSIHFTADAQLLELIHERLQKLELFFDHIIEASVTLKLEKNGQVQDKIVEVKINVPGEQLVAKDTSKKFEVSLDAVVEALRKQIVRYKEKMQQRKIARA